MKAADTHTIQEIGVPSLVLMERAALGTVEMMRRCGTDLSRPLFVCGSGNNGGDGFAAARLLKEEGIPAEVFFAGRESSQSGECRLQKEIAEKLGIVIRTDFPEQEYTVIVDALFGVGLSRDIEGRYCDVVRWMNRQSCAKVAVDIPSGVCARTGKILGTAFCADLTVAMACVKLGCELYPGKTCAGRTEAVPIGIDTEFFRDDAGVCFTYDRGDIPRLLPERRPDSHKGSYGRALMLTGSEGMAGACFLSAKAAYAAGAGLVHIYTPEANRTVLQGLLPEAVMTCYRKYKEEELQGLLDRADVVCIGCGLGTGERSEQMLTYTLKHVKVPCIVDADGLNLLSRHLELLEQTEAPVILTPHMKEMSRLTGYPVPEISADRLDILSEFTERYPVVCALKDSRTLVKRAGRSVFLNLAGNAAMAKAGSGDVLAGIITGLAAQGMEAFDSAALGVFLHGCAGDEARAAKGAYSVLARDLISGLERCMNLERCMIKTEETE